MVHHPEGSNSEGCRAEELKSFVLQYKTCEMLKVS